MMKSSSLKIFLFVFFVCSFYFCAGGQNVLNVKTYGAKGDGRSDDTQSIQKAINEGKKSGKGVLFPSGVYMISDVAIETSIHGQKNTIIKKIASSKLDQYTFCSVRGQSDLVIKNIVFDGSVKLDGSDNPIEGAIPLFIYSSSSLRVIDCSFINSPNSGLRIEGSSDIYLSGCFQKNSNGVFGDGYYIENSHHIDVIKCVADRYTRIGFVTEKDTRNVNFTDCVAKNGYGASVLKGGLESNAGFWSELCANITLTRCTSQNNIHYGFVMTSGIDPAKVDHKTVSFTLKDCVSDRSDVGFKTGSAGNPVNTVLDNCKALQAYTGFIAYAKSSNDQFYYKNCRSQLRPSQETASNDAGFMWESEDYGGNPNAMPLFSYSNCFVEYLAPASTAKLFDRNTNNADLSTYSGGDAKIIIDQMKNSLKGNGVILKAIKGNPYVELRRTDADLRFMVKNSNVKKL